MKISIAASQAANEVLLGELWSEFETRLPASDFYKLGPEEAYGEKGFLDSLVIAILSEIAAEIVGKILSEFTKKYRVKLHIEEPDGRTIDISYFGDNDEELATFLRDSIETDTKKIASE